MMTTTVYDGGVFHTRNPRTAGATAMLVSNEKIDFIGAAAECHDRAGGRYRTVDLAGAHVVAGFTDAHTHSAQLALQSSEIDLSAARSLAQALALVEERVRAARTTTSKPSAWVFGGRWNNRAWTVSTMPTRFQLDAVTGDIPVALHHGDLHTYWLNTAALEQMGIDRNTPDPVGGYYARDSAGELTGIIGEAAAFAAELYFAPFTSSELDATIGAALESFLAHGVTSIHDLDGEDSLRSFQALRDADRLPLRVHKLMPVAVLDGLIEREIRSGDGDEWLRYGAVKIFGDGSLSSHTCLLHEPYPDEPGNRGTAVTPPDLLHDLATRCIENGLAVAIHAIGDAAVTNAIAVLERFTGSALSGVRLPNRIEHVQHLAVSDVSRLGALDVVSCMQPASATSDMDLVDALLSERDIASYAWRSILAAGGTLAFSSDAPVETVNPLVGIHAALTRQRAGGYPDGGWQAEERLSRSEAFAAYTTGPSRASGEESTKGILAPGFLADFTALDRDPFSCEAEELLDVASTMTVVGGEVRWAR